MKDAVEIKLQIQKLDKRCLWEFTVPKAPASEDKIQHLERSLSCRLPTPYRHFLSHANGWASFYQEVDLFGVEDLYFESDQQRLARYRLFEALQYEKAVISDTMLPIAVSRFDADVFAIEGSGAAKSGEVSWFHNGLVEVFADFDDFFASMLEYNKREVIDLLREQ